MNIKDIQKKYFGTIEPLDLEVLISLALRKPREFVLAHPEYRLTPNQELGIKNYTKRRMNNEPIAYITGHKEFFRLDFKVNKNVLIPRPETELLVESVIQNTLYQIPNTIIDVGTGSGCIIISIAAQLKNKELRIKNYALYGTDISGDSLEIAKQNAKKHNVNKKINFLKGNLLQPVFKNKLHQTSNIKHQILIVANLPYLSKKIYESSSDDVKKYEPMSALVGGDDGLCYYEKLFEQIKKLLFTAHCSLFVVLEISPEQKNKIKKLAKNYFSNAKINFKKDLAGKWRVCEIISL